MARVTLSGIITDINGSINGWTFQNSLAGKTVRVKPVQKKITSNFHQIYKTGPATIRKLWNSLTLLERSAWQTYQNVVPFVDVYGNAKTLGNYQYFYSCIARQKLQGSYVNALAPTGTPAPGTTPIFTVTINPLTLILNFAIPYSNADETLWIFTTQPLFGKSLSNRRFYLFTDAVVAVTGASLDITSAYTSRHDFDAALLASNPLLTVNIYVFLVNTRSGLSSPAVFTQGVQ